MLMLEILAILGLAGVVGLLYGRSRPSPSNKPSRVGTPEVSPTPRIERPLNVAQLQAVRNALAEKLWSAVFGASSRVACTVPERDAAREAVLAALKATTPNSRHLPRRPDLLTTLIAAIRSARSSGEQIARIIGQDPVLTADVLRLSNSALYRATSSPVESIQRAVAICGDDGLQALVTTAMLQPIFRASSKNFPLFPSVLWERTETAARAAEIYARDIRREDRFEAQLLALLSALGPLAVYRVLIDHYAIRPALAPDPGVFKTLIREFGPAMAHRVAEHWDVPPRLLAALEGGASEGLSAALAVGELFATLGQLESRSLFTLEESLDYGRKAEIPEELFVHMQRRLMGKFKTTEGVKTTYSPARARLAGSLTAEASA